jgi:hypothetical protein
MSEPNNVAAVAWGVESSGGAPDRPNEPPTVPQPDPRLPDPDEDETPDTPPNEPEPVPIEDPRPDTQPPGPYIALHWAIRAG